MYLNIFLKKVYIQFSTNSCEGRDNLVETLGFLKDVYENVLDREILECLYSTEKWLSASEITNIIKAESSDRDVKYPDRNVRYRLKRLVKRNDINRAKRETTGHRGRAPEIYGLSENLRKTIDDSFTIKDIERVPVGNGLPLGKIISMHKYREIKGQKTTASRGWETAPEDRNLWTLSAILTAKRLGHPAPPDGEIEKFKKNVLSDREIRS